MRWSMVDCGQGRWWWLIRAQPRSHSRAWELIGGGATERGGHRDPGSSLTRAWAAVRRLGDGGEEMVEEALGVGSARAWREEKENGEMCGGGRRGSLFI
jgi:hypothetical protein